MKKIKALESLKIFLENVFCQSWHDVSPIGLFTLSCFDYLKFFQIFMGSQQIKNKKKCRFFFSFIKFCILSFYEHVTFLDSFPIQSCLKLNSSFQNDGIWSKFHYQYGKSSTSILAFQSDPFKKIQKHHCSNSYIKKWPK